jgi:hypothetical protein
VSKLQQYNDSLFDQLRLQQDDLADQAVSTLVQAPDLIKTINSWEVLPKVLPPGFPDTLKDFFGFYERIKETADPAVLSPGQDFFDQKGDLYLAMLGFYSLPYCYAFGDGAQVLVRSKRIVDQIGERLGETASFVLDIFRPGAFFKDQIPYLTCAKVRLIHAFSRYFISHYSKDWNPDFGQPVNQEDMLGTNLAFSFIVLRGLSKLGFQPSEEEYHHLLAYWKWIGTLMGIDVSYWPDTTKEAFELDKLIRKRHLKPTDAGKKLINSLIAFYQETIPDQILKDQVVDIQAFLLGKEASNALGLRPARSLQGNILGLLFTFSGWKNYGGKKGYQTFRHNLEKQQIEQFGKISKINLPERG